jgi:glycerol-3-phosphate dehydrogenase
VDHGATVLNYAEVVRLLKKQDLVRGIVVRDLETSREHEVRARVVINATGVFADSIRRLDEPSGAEVILPSQGIHVVLDRSFMPSDSAIMVPKTDDGRVLFCIPWHDRVLVGTTDTAVGEILEEPRPLDEEIEFLLTHAARYLTKDPKRSDILSAFAGLRPLVRSTEANGTAAIPRDHSVLVSQSGLVTVVGGKWTTYRKMAEDAVAQAELVGGFEMRPCQTESLRLHGWQTPKKEDGHYRVYGAEQEALRALAKADPRHATVLHPRLPYREAEVIWAVRNEMARTVEDVLSRRTRALLLEARASLEIAPRVAAIMAEELKRSKEWEAEQVASFRQVAGGYVIASR